SEGTIERSIGREGTRDMPWSRDTSRRGGETRAGRCPPRRAGDSHFEQRQRRAQGYKDRSRQSADRFLRWQRRDEIGKPEWKEIAHGKGSAGQIALQRTGRNQRRPRQSAGRRS